MERQSGIRHYNRRLKDIQGMTLASDLFSSVVFEDKKAVQDVLRILTGIKQLKIERVEPQRSYRNLYGHGAVLDVWAEGIDGAQYNMEIQIAENEDHLRRSRFIQSRIDSRIFAEGEVYGKLPELYLIFITKRDFLRSHSGVSEVIRSIKGTAMQAGNGVHEIYANMQYPAEDDEKTRLLKYICDTNNPDIPTDGFENLAKRVKYLKNDAGGIRYMCEVAERERAEGRAEGEMFHLIQLTMKKSQKGLRAGEIAEIMEEEVGVIDEILLAAAETGTDDSEKIFDCLWEFHHREY